MKHLTRAASTAALTLATVALPATALAHTGDHVHGGLMAGLTHPVTGLDHLVALVLFGALLAGTTLKEKQLGFVAAGISLAAGFAGGVALGGHVAMEAVITGSALLFAAALAFPASVRGKAACAVAFLLGAHGWAHGVEMTGSLAGFGAGFMASSVLLMLAGLPLGQQIQKIAPALRAILAAGAALGLMLLAG